MPIDLFFASLAEVHQDHAIGVVLSGTGTDGTLGLKAIKDHGGITFAQEPQSAAYDGMPQSAIDAEVVDFILPPEKIPEQLLVLHDISKVDFVGEEGNTKQMQEMGFKQILSVLRARRGVDITYYKPTTIHRRINRRIALSMQRDIAEYLACWKENKTEKYILYQDLLITVPAFLRDQKAFEVYGSTWFTDRLKDRQDK